LGLEPRFLPIEPRHLASASQRARTMARAVIRRPIAMSMLEWLPLSTVVNI
jgi:hypothetical protein